MDIAGHRWTSRHIAITIVSTTGQFGFPVMTEKQVVQEGGEPSCTTCFSYCRRRRRNKQFRCIRLVN